MAIPFSIVDGTNAHDIFVDLADGEFAFGHKGNDLYIVNDFNFTLLAGGMGHDTYLINSGAVILDHMGRDMIQLPNISLDQASFATIHDSRHALIFDNETGSFVILLELPSEGYNNDTISLGGATFNARSFIDGIHTSPNYLGDYDWEEMAEFGQVPLSTQDVNETREAVKELITELQTEADVEQIALLYEASLGREPDIEGLNFWIDVFEGGYTMDQLSHEFLVSPEFEARAGEAAEMSVEEFVDTMYLNILDREADQAGYDFWVGQVEDNGLTYEDILTYFSTSPENYDQAPYLENLQESAPGHWDWA